MPDIVSRIKIEAQGADQAAREIRKLQEAYKQVSAAAQGISPSNIGGGDPFSKAVAPNSGVMAGGQSNADVAARETRNQSYQRQVQERQASNSSFNSALRGPPGQIGGAFSIAEAAGTGRGGAAAGGLASLAGGLLGGPAGIALMAGAAGAMGIQKFAETAFGRMENVYGGGISQRLGATYANTQDYMIGLGRSGVPIGMVNALMGSASSSGAQFNKGTVDQFGLFADVATGTGADASLLGQLLGSTQRAGVTAGYNTLAAGAGAFGRGGMNTFLTELNRTIESSLTSGISLSQEEVNRRGNLLAAFGSEGGLSATGAASLLQRSTQRGQSAALLSNPEDIIAFQAMRREGEGVTETLRRMEESPIETNEAVLARIQRISGGDQDLMRMKVQRYLGAGTTISQADAFIRSGGEVSEVAGGDLRKAGIRGKTFDASGALVDEDEARRVYAAQQIEALQGIQETSLEIASALGKVAGWITGNPIDTNATNVGFGGVRKDLIKGAKMDISQTITEVDAVTAQNVQNLNVEVEAANFDLKSLKRADQMLANPNFATNASTIAALRGASGIQGILDEFAGSTGNWMMNYTDLKESGFEAFGGGVGGFDDLFQQTLSAVRGQVIDEAGKGLRIGTGKWSEVNEAKRSIDPLLSEFLNTNITTTAELTSALAELKSALIESGYVLTDGGIDIPTRRN